MDAPRRFSMKHNRNGLGFYDGLEEDADGYLMTVAEHERLMAEARAKALEDGLARAAMCRENWCLASPGSDEEFRSFLEGFDAAIRAMKGE